MVALRTSNLMSIRSYALFNIKQHLQLHDLVGNMQGKVIKDYTSIMLEQILFLAELVWEFSSSYGSFRYKVYSSTISRRHLDEITRRMARQR